MKVAVLGAGAFGTALGNVLVRNQYEVSYYDPRVSDNRLEDVIHGASYILLCVPSEKVEEVLPLLPREVPLIVASKGFLTDMAFREFTDWMVVSGAGSARNFAEKSAIALTISDWRIKDLLAADYIRFDFAADRRGILLCGAMKNTYAFGAGRLGLEPETEEIRQYFNDATDEMRMILALNGSDPELTRLACWQDDLELTATPESRNYRFGASLREDSDARPSGTLEGVAAILRILDGEMKLPNEDEMPILKEILNCRKWK